MAIIVASNMADKFTKTYAEPVTAEEKARYRAARDWSANVWVKTGKKPYEQPIPEDLIAKSVQITRGEHMYAFANILVGLANFSVNQAFKDAVEAIEPGVHQFVPIEVLKADGTRYPDTYYLFHVHTFVDAINPDYGGLIKHLGYNYDKGDPDDYSYHIGRGGPETRAVYKDRIAGRAAWRDKRMKTDIFFSDALVKRLRDAGLEGWAVAWPFAEV